MGIFAKLDTNQNGCITDQDAVGAAPTSQNGTSSGSKKSKQKQKPKQRDRDLFETDEEIGADRTSNPVASRSGVKVKKTTSADDSRKKGGMVLGDENVGEKVRGADGKVRRKVKKPKKSKGGGDEV